MADTVKQALLLPEDMAELRDMKRHGVFLSLKRYLAMVRPRPFFLTYSLHFPLLIFFSPFPWQTVQASFRAEEIANSCHRQMKEEEGRRNAAVDAFHVAEKSIQELKKKPQEEEKERKYTAVALENVEKQVGSQRLLLHTAEDNLASSRT